MWDNLYNTFDPKTETDAVKRASYRLMNAGDTDADTKWSLQHSSHLFELDKEKRSAVAVQKLLALVQHLTLISLQTRKIRNEGICNSAGDQICSFWRMTSELIDSCILTTIK